MASIQAAIKLHAGQSLIDGVRFNPMAQRCKEEAKKIGLNFGGNETITIKDKRDIIDDQEKEMDDLIIKNVSLGLDNKLSEINKKEEPVKKEAGQK